MGFGCGRRWERVVQLLVPIRAAARCRYLFDSANSPRAPLELSPCTPRPTATSTLIGLDDGDDSWHQSRPLPNKRRGEEGRGPSWRRRRASLPSPRRMARQLLRGARIARLTRSARGSDALGYGTVAGRISRDGVTTSNFLFMAVLQHKRVNTRRMVPTMSRRSCPCVHPRRRTKTRRTRN